MGVMLVTLPLPGMLTKLNASIQQQRMVATDGRIDVVTEAVNALRMLKMFAWEERIKERISAKREVELGLIWKRRLATMATMLLNNILPMITMSVTYAVYTTVQKRELTAATVFSSMTIFELVKGQMWLVFYMLNGFVTAGVSLQRINTFLTTVSGVWRG
jgi:ABC-type multidrug transport system fused ATPase/permease subunit